MLPSKKYENSGKNPIWRSPNRKMLTAHNDEERI